MPVAIILVRKIAYTLFVIMVGIAIRSWVRSGILPKSVIITLLVVAIIAVLMTI